MRIHHYCVCFNGSVCFIILFASIVINESEQLNYLDYTIESIQKCCFLVFLDISLRLNLKLQMRAQLFHVSTSLRSKQSFASQSFMTLISWHCQTCPWSHVIESVIIGLWKANSVPVFPWQLTWWHSLCVF